MVSESFSRDILYNSHSVLIRHWFKTNTGLEGHEDTSVNCFCVPHCRVPASCLEKQETWLAVQRVSPHPNTCSHLTVSHGRAVASREGFGVTNLGQLICSGLAGGRGSSCPCLCGPNPLRSSVIVSNRQAASISPSLPLGRVKLKRPSELETDRDSPDIQTVVTPTPSLWFFFLHCRQNARDVDDACGPG